MALPKIIQKLFSDAGKGTKLNSEIIPPLKDKTSEELFTFIGEKGELTYNTTEKRIVAHDGVTKGGIPMAKKSEVDAIDVGVTSVNGNSGDITPEQTGCLPLRGGTMTGAIVDGRGSYGLICSNADNSMVRVYGGSTAGTGANLDLYGGENAENGAFVLRARNSSKYIVLKGNTDGSLKWNDQLVQTAQADGNQNGYIKFSNTITFQWGYYGGESATGTINFPLTFSGVLVVFTQIHGDVAEPNLVSVHSKTATGFQFKSVKQHGNSAVAYARPFWWFAIGTV